MKNLINIKIILMLSILSSQALSASTSSQNEILKLLTSFANSHGTAVVCNGCDLSNIDFTIPISSLLAGVSAASIPITATQMTQSLVQLLNNLTVTLQCTNLQYANLKGLTLQTNAADLSCPNTLLSTNLSNAILNYASLEKANLRNVNLTSAQLNYANISGADLTGSSITGILKKGLIAQGVITPSGANSPESNIVNILISIANGKPVNCSGCDLSLQDFSDTQIQFLFSLTYGDSSLIPDEIYQGQALGTLIGNTLKQGIPVHLQCANLKKSTLRDLEWDGIDLTCPDPSGDTSTNLSGANMIGISLKGANLTRANMSGASLDNASFTEKAILDHASLYSASMTGTDFTGASMVGVGLGSNDVTNAIFKEADLSDLIQSEKRSLTTIASPVPEIIYSGFKSAKVGTLTLADFTGANIQGADFSNLGNIGHMNFNGANLTGAHFDNTDMSCGPNCGSNFYGTILDNSTFTNSNLSGANLKTASLNGADFTGATVTGTLMDNINCKGTKFINVTLDGTKGTTMTNADCSGYTDAGPTSFSGATITGMNLNNLIAQNAVFDHSTITDTDFTGSNLAGSSFYDTTLAGNINLSGVSLKEANLSNVQVTGAITNINQNIPFHTGLYTDFSGATLDKASNLDQYLGENLDTDTWGNIMTGQCKAGSMPMCAAFCHMNPMDACHPFDIYNTSYCIGNLPYGGFETLNECQAQGGNPNCQKQCDHNKCYEFVYGYQMNTSSWNSTCANSPTSLGQKLQDFGGR